MFIGRVFSCTLWIGDKDTWAEVSWPARYGGRKRKGSIYCVLSPSQPILNVFLLLYILDINIIENSSFTQLFLSFSFSVWTVYIRNCWHVFTFQYLLLSRQEPVDTTWTYCIYIYLCLWSVSMPSLTPTKDFKINGTLPFLPSTFVVAWEGELPCTKWDCECAFKRQRGCCCASPDLQEIEDQIFLRVMDLSVSVSQLGDSILEVIGTLEHGHW